MGKQIPVTAWGDDGCDIHPICLTCPLPRCRYDEPYDVHLDERQQRNAAVVAAHDAGTNIIGLAKEFGLSRRQVHRILEGRGTIATASLESHGL